MIEKLKQYAAAAYAGVLLILGAVVFFLLNKNNKLQGQVSDLKTDKLLDKDKQVYDNQKTEAKNAEDDYKHLRDAYVSESGDGSELPKGPTK